VIALRRALSDRLDLGAGPGQPARWGPWWPATRTAWRRTNSRNASEVT